MKKLNYFFPSMLLLLALGCSNHGSEVETRGYGQVAFECKTDCVVDEQTRATATFELPTALIPQDVEQFSLHLTGSYVDSETGGDSIYDATFATVAEYHEETPMLGAGNYTATISLGDEAEEAMDTPCFAGTHSFEVVARKVSSETITVALSNSLVRLNSSSWFDSYYKDATFTLTTSTGNSFEFVPNDNKLLFVAPGTTFTLTGSATKISNDVAVTFPSTQIAGETVLRTLNTIVVEAGSVGGGTISVVFDENTVDITPTEIELNPEV